MPAQPICAGSIWYHRATVKVKPNVPRSTQGTSLTDSRQRMLRKLPAVHQLLQSTELQSLRPACTRADLSRWARDAVASCRREITAQQGADAAMETEQYWQRRALAAVQRLAELDRGGSIQGVWNATGVILHTNLGRAPLAAEAAQRAAEAAGAANVELNLEHGRRSTRGERAHRLLAELAGAEDALVVNNCAAATLLALQAFAQGKEVIIARSQLVEIGGGFRLPEVFTAAQVALREVGTTNRTYLSDYEAALSDETGAVLRVHRSNFWQAGFVTEPSLEAIATLAKERGLPCIDDLGSGCVHDLSPWNIVEPTVQQSIAAGASVTLFSGDKLFGGPQCGMLVGSRDCIARLRKHPMMRALRADKLVLAALEATIELHLDEKPFERLPALRMIAEPADQIRVACERLATELKQRLGSPADHPGIVFVGESTDPPGGLQWEVAATECAIGGGSVPNVKLPSFAMQFTCRHEDALARELRGGHLHGRPPIQCRVADGSVWLELRTIAPEQRRTLGEHVAAAIQRWRNDSQGDRQHDG